jgi:NAD(P)H-hydrate repair Nnr-like enzyme with NAD(P)H-hydrate dehydratase domain
MTDKILVPKELIELLKEISRLHQDKGVVLTVHMNELALLLEETKINEATD